MRRSRCRSPMEPQLNTAMAAADHNNQIKTTLWHNPDRNGHF